MNTYVFPPDAITSIIDTNGISGTTCGNLVATSTDAQTLLYGQLLTDNNGFSEIKIGTPVYLRARADRFNPETFAPVVFTNQAITCTRPSGAATLATVVYIPRDINNTTSSLSFQQGIVGGFTYGEIIISFFAFVIFIVAAYSFFYHWIRGYNITTK